MFAAPTRSGSETARNRSNRHQTKRDTEIPGSSNESIAQTVSPRLPGKCCCLRRGSDRRWHSLGTANCPSRKFGGGRVLCFVKRIYFGRSAAGIGQPVGFGRNIDCTDAAVAPQPKADIALT